MAKNPPRHQYPPGAANPRKGLKSLRRATAIGGVLPQRAPRPSRASRPPPPPPPPPPPTPPSPHGLTRTAPDARHVTFADNEMPGSAGGGWNRTVVPQRSALRCVACVGGVVVGVLGVACRMWHPMTSIRPFCGVAFCRKH